MQQRELPSIYQSIIHRSRYSRYLPNEKRRESWEESIDRYINFMYKKVKDNSNISEEDKNYIHSILGATCGI